MRPKLIYQESSFDCAIAALGMMYNFLNKSDEALSFFKNHFSTLSNSGYSIKEIEFAADKLDIRLNSYFCEYLELVEEIKNNPLIALIKSKHEYHYVLMHYRNKKIYIYDSSAGVSEHNEEEFRQIYTGVLIKVEDFKRQKDNNLILKSIIQNLGFMTNSFLLALFISFLTLVTVWINQIILYSVFDNSNFTLSFILISILTIFSLSFLSFLRNLLNFNLLKKYEEKIYFSEFFLKNQSNTDSANKVYIFMTETLKFVNILISNLTIIILSFLLFSQIHFFLIAMSIYFLMSAIINYIFYQQKKSETKNLLKSIEVFFTKRKSKKLINLKSAYSKKVLSEKRQMITNNVYHLSFNSIKKIFTYFILSVFIYQLLEGGESYENLYVVYFGLPLMFSKIDELMKSLIGYLLIKPLKYESNFYYKNLLKHHQQIIEIKDIKINDFNFIDKNLLSHSISINASGINYISLNKKNIEKFYKSLLNINQIYEGNIYFNNYDVREISINYLDNLIFKIDINLITDSETVGEYLKNNSVDKDKLLAISDALIQLRLSPAERIESLTDIYLLLKLQLIYIYLWERDSKLYLIDCNNLSKPNINNLMLFCNQKNLSQNWFIFMSDYGSL